jgi:hypothetical protein
MANVFSLTFTNGRTACAVEVDRSVDLSDALCRLGLSKPTPTLVLVGGAGGLGDAEMDRLRPLFVEALVPLIGALDAAVVDGGTDAGVMHLIGEAHAEAKATFPLVGVAATGTVVLPDVWPPSSSDVAQLESHHTHFVLVPGSEWGDESPWLSCVASVLAREAGSVTLLVDGGEITWEDVSQSVEARRPVIVIGGSGRTADTLARTLRGETTDERARKLAASGMLSAVDLTASVGTFVSALERTLSREKRTI